MKKIAVFALAAAMLAGTIQTASAAAPLPLVPGGTTIPLLGSLPVVGPVLQVVGGTLAGLPVVGAILSTGTLQPLPSLGGLIGSVPALGLPVDSVLDGLPVIGPLLLNANLNDPQATLSRIPLVGSALAGLPTIGSLPVIGGVVAGLPFLGTTLAGL